MEEKENQQIENTTAHSNDHRDLDQMELEAFRQCWQTLSASLAEIKELRGGETAEVDPVNFVKKEVETLRSQFTELKEMISALRQQPQQQAASPQQQSYQRYQPVQQPVPLLPYYSTPNFAPMIPINQ